MLERRHLESHSNHDIFILKEKYLLPLETKRCGFKTRRIFQDGRSNNVNVLSSFMRSEHVHLSLKVPLERECEQSQTIFSHCREETCAKEQKWVIVL